MNWMFWKKKTEPIKHEHELVEMIACGHAKNIMHCKTCDKFYNKRTGKEIKGWINGKEI